MVMFHLEPLVKLHRAGYIRMYHIKAYISPSGTGWHVRFDCDTKGRYTTMELQMLGGDDAWRYVFNAIEGFGNVPPLFDGKIREGGALGEEKYNAAMTKRIREAFKCTK